MSVSACKPSFTLPEEIVRHFGLTIEADSSFDDQNGYYRLILSGNTCPKEAEIIRKIKEYFSQYFDGQVAFRAEQPHSIAAITDTDGYICNVTAISRHPCKIIITIVNQL